MLDSKPWVVGAAAVLCGCRSDVQNRFGHVLDMTGQKTSLPAKDALGKKVPRVALTVLTVPCAACFSVAGFRQAAALSKRPLVIVTKQTDPAEAQLDAWSEQADFVLVDPAARYVPRDALDYPPVVLHVSAEGTVEGQESDPAKLMAFIARRMSH